MDIFLILSSVTKNCLYLFNKIKKPRHRPCFIRDLLLTIILYNYKGLRKDENGGEE